MPMIARRGVLRGALAASAVTGLGLLGACRGTSGVLPQPAPSSASTAPTSPSNPFGVSARSSCEAVVFGGGYGIDYVTSAAKVLQDGELALQVKVTGTTKVAGDLTARLREGKPPDLFDNSGGDMLPVGELAPQLDDLTSLVDAPGLDGGLVRASLHPAILSAGTVDHRLVVLNQVLSVHALWYSASLFETNGWKPPRTWAEAHELGRKARDKGKHLFCWSKQTATYFETMVIASAIKQGGDRTRLALDNLAPGCWSDAAVQGVLQALKAIIADELLLPDGATTDFQDAQASWAKKQDVLLYPCGSWIENETLKQVTEGFQMTGVPDLALNDSPALGMTALHVSPTEGFVVPLKARNAPAAKELLRVLLSREAATEFARTKLSLPAVRDVVPEDAFGSTALASQLAMLDAAKGGTFDWRFVNHYGTQRDHQVLWRGFLAGELDVKTLTAELQHITDSIRADDSIKKYTAA